MTATRSNGGCETVEALLGTTPQACQAGLTIAMRLEELERPVGHPG
jgi:hypothetical protein